jgi:hypothetical protein
MTVHVAAEQLHHIVEAASLAPSVHNTQPWRFVAQGSRLELHAEPLRRLEVLDPDGRQLHLSCGAALFHARIAGRALGLDAAVRLLPDPSDPAHLADLVLTRGAAASDDDVRVAAAILTRHTHRGAFDQRPVPAALLSVLQAAAAAEAARLDLVEDEDHLIELQVLLARADAAEEQDEQYRAELHEWLRTDGTTGDGIPTDAIDRVSGSALRQRSFESSGSSPTTPPPVAEHPAVVVLVTDDDEPSSWLQAGQALASVLLHAADHGVQAQPLGQVTDVVGYRLGLRRALGILGMPQLVLRMGYAGKTMPTPRRPVADVLSTVAD